MRKPIPSTNLFCNDVFARVIFEDDYHNYAVYWLDIRDYRGSRWTGREGMHLSISGMFGQIKYHPKIKVLRGVDEWMEENKIIWPFTEDERFLFELTWG